MEPLSQEEQQLLDELQAMQPKVLAAVPTCSFLQGSIIRSVVMWAIKQGLGRLVLNQRETIIRLALYWYDAAAKTVDVPGIPDGTEVMLEKVIRDMLETTLRQLFDGLELIT